jgi:opacity protein-like surface antigen
MRKIALFSVLVMLVSFSTFAASLPNYAVLKLGGYFPQSDDLDEFDNSFYGEIGFGHYFNPNIALEFGVGYTESSAGISDPTGSVDVDITIVPITLGVKVLTTADNFEPYAMAGIGLYYTNVDASVSLAGIGSASDSENDTVFGFYLGVGANYNFTPNTFIGVEGKYFWASPSFEGIDVDIDGINVTANIGYRF